MENSYEIKGKKLTCTLEGDPKNQPIILIHDWTSHRGLWRLPMSTLKEKYFCIAVDLLGFGGSDKPESGDYSLSAQGQRIISLADQLGLKNFSLIGHSMGGQIAMFIAAVIAPQRVEKLVIVAPTVTGRFSDEVEKLVFPFMRNARKWSWLYNIAGALVKFQPFAERIFKTWFYDFRNIQFENWEVDRSAALNVACSISNDESGKAIHALDLSQYIRKITAPTLIISGKQDGTVRIDQSLLAQTLIPNNNLAIIEKCGHFPMYEKPVQFMKALALMF
jgi:pimeloyl-ACP methyl ester carboxylesterase